MKTVFIINPSAGQGKGIDKLKERIRAAAQETGIEAGIYLTRGPQDGEIFARTFTEETRGVCQGRLIACGGDGTLNEVLNGVLGGGQVASEGVGQSAGSWEKAPLHRSEHISIGAMPIGTGNDFVRNFPEAGDFLDPVAQLLGTSLKCDAIRYWGWIDGREQMRYCANMFNIGFDCNVVDTAATLKKYPLVSGSFAYLLAVGAMFVKKKGAKLRVELDGQVIEDGPVLLTALCNGGYCGGGVNSTPHASVHDGVIDANIIYNVSRRDFLKKFPYYAKGTHVDLPDVDKIICMKRCRNARITPLDNTMRLCTDGEIVDAGTVNFAVEAGCWNVLLPKK
jgi:diacylglycerol kinase family enzyme